MKENNETKEQFAIRQNPTISGSWGILWEHSGTEGGYTNEDGARRSALAQNGAEASAADSQTWEW